MAYGMWGLTILLEIVLFLALQRKPFWWFRTYIFFNLIESIPLYLVLHHGTKLEYKELYYFIDLVNIALGVMTVTETWKRLNRVAFSMNILLGMIVASYGGMMIHRPDITHILHDELLIPNLGCLAIWIFAMWRYNGDMTTEEITTPPESLEPEETTELPAEQAEELPGAPAPTEP